MEKIITSLKNCNTLEELFKVWYQKQINQEEYADSQKKLITFAKNHEISLTSFCVDGVIYDSYWDENKKGKKVLYILREENGSKEVERNDEDGGFVIGKGPDKKDFWVKEQFNNVRDQKVIEAKLPVMLRKLINARLLISSKEEKGNLNKNCNCGEIMEKAAFMNINKMGGFSSVHWPTLNLYAEIFQDEIKREIELLFPDVIVCCGTFYLIKEKIFPNKIREFPDGGYQLPLNGKDIIIYDLPHTARRGIKVDDYGKAEILPGETVKKKETEEELKTEIKDFIDNNKDCRLDVLQELYDIIKNADLNEKQL